MEQQLMLDIILNAEDASTLDIVLMKKKVKEISPNIKDDSDFDKNRDMLKMMSSLELKKDLEPRVPTTADTTTAANKPDDKDSKDKKDDDEEAKKILEEAEKKKKEAAAKEDGEPAGKDTIDITKEGDIKKVEVSTTPASKVFPEDDKEDKK
jgi:hypothetical protein